MITKKQLLTILIGFGLMFFVTGVVLPAPEEYFEASTWNQIFKQTDVVDYPIIFIHGIAGNMNHWKKTIRTLVGNDYCEMRYENDHNIMCHYLGKKTPVPVWNISYYSNNIIDESLHGNLTLYATRCQKMIELIKKITGKSQVVIIAHSMGGLVARKYMTLDRTCWNSVYRILTIATPNEGVATSPGIVGQFEDLRKESPFIKTLNNNWYSMSGGSCSKWGVIGAIDAKSIININLKNSPDATDSSGPGFVTISSAIPFGEWREAVGINFGKIATHTQHFGFRLAVNTQHMNFLYHEATFQGIRWAIGKE